MTASRSIEQRVEQAIEAVLPPGASPRWEKVDGPLVHVKINGRPLTAYWLGEGWPFQVKEALARLGRRRPDLFVARQMSLGAQAEAARHGIGWVDETGAAEVATDWLVLAKAGRPLPHERTAGWTPAFLGIAEALLVGTRPTVADTSRVTGLSFDTCRRALGFLTDLELLAAYASRGRNSARRILDQNRLLGEYAAATKTLQQDELRVGVLWTEPVEGVVSLGKHWDSAGITWAATGAVAAAVVAPFLTDVGTAEVMVKGRSVAALDRAASVARVKAMEGGRLLLRAFPSEATARLVTRQDGLWLAPWPRIYADLSVAGVRGEDAAEHLREIMIGR